MVGKSLSLGTVHAFIAQPVCTPWQTATSSLLPDLAGVAAKL